MLRFVTFGVVSASLLLAGPRPTADACTNFLVTKGASVDGSTMITYAADSHELYGELYFRPARQYPAGAVRKIFDWDTGKYLGTIAQARQTYRVVGNMNEHQVVIGETTYGGRKELRDLKGGIDYGSLMYVALERAKTAREAIGIMTRLVAEHGYFSHGESFSIADPNEVWIMDMIGKGPGSRGAVWVARRIPDGYVSAHANQTRIRTFPRDDPTSCVYAKDVVSFARSKGYWKGEEKTFSFADAYAPPSCRDLRIREARVWSFFRQVAPSRKIPIDYVRCRKGAKPMPLWIKPDQKLSARDLMRMMRDHFEGTELDMTKDVGAGPFGLPYRWRPLVWKVGSNKYLNERAIATQQTGFSFVSQSRRWLPGRIGGLLWFSVDDAASTVYLPMYAGITKVPKAYAVGTADFKRFSWESAFWVFNWVSNYAYSRYRDMIQDIRKVQVKLENELFTAQAELEKKAVALHKLAPARADALLTAYAKTASERVVSRWRLLGQELLVRYLDGNVRNAEGKVTHPPYPKGWYKRIATETGDHFLADPKQKGAEKTGAAAKRAASKGVSAASKAKRRAGRRRASAAAPVVPQQPAGCGCLATGAGPAAPLGLVFVLLTGWLTRRRRQANAARS
ncbi:MAG: C69 family dipeptidase [bacterium]